MPRTTAVECPGCPPIRALTTDVLGLVKVVEARGKAVVPKVVDTWGPPDASRGIVAASFDDHEARPIIAVARKNNLVEILNPLNGNSLAAIEASEASSDGHSAEADPIIGLHILKTKRNELSSRSNVLLLCSEKGKASLRSVSMDDTSLDSTTSVSQNRWDVSAAGRITCSAMSANEKHALFGGKGIEVNMWDLESCSRIWTSKPPPSNSLGIFSPTWFTAATVLSKDDHNKIVAGTNNYQVRLYDIAAQRRPVISVNFRESTIKAVTADPDGHTVYVGTGSGDLASFDMRTGKLVGCFTGKCSGSIRSITRHPEKPVLASCGLDGYLRIWDTKTRRLLSAVFLKQHLTAVSIDSHFTYEECPGDSADPQASNQIKAVDASDSDDDDELLYSTRSMKPKKKEKNKEKSRKKSSSRPDDNDAAEVDHSLRFSDDKIDQRLGSKRREPSAEGKGRSKTMKQKKSKRL